MAHFSPRRKRRLAITLSVFGVVVLAGCASLAGLARSLAEPVVTVSGMDVVSGALAGGETVTFTGENLAEISRVTFGGEAADAMTATNGSVKVTVPHSADYVAGPVEVELEQDRDVVATLDYAYETLTPVDRQLEYAFAHWDNYNLAEFGNYNDWGGDCMNFVSQTLLARGWVENPEWFNDAQVDWAPAFVDAPSFDDWVAANPDLGLTVLTLDQIDQVKIGDIVRMDWDVNGYTNHVQIVSGFEYVDGERKVLMVGHNVDTNYRSLEEAITVENPGATASFYSVP